MVRVTHTAFSVALFVVLSGAAGPALVAQQDNAQAPADKPPAPAKPAAKPADKPAKDGQAPSSQAPAPDSGTAAAPQQQRPTADDNPFPEDVSRQAADDANKDANKGEANKGADTGTSKQADKPADSNDPPSGDAPAGVSSSRSNLDPEDAAEAPDTHDSGRRKLTVDPALHNPAKAQDDVKVGQFYLGSGDYQGAYVRFKEAEALDPANVDAIFGVAEAARHLHHVQEAEHNYSLYLTIVPDGSSAKAAKRELRSLQANE